MGRDIQKYPMKWKILWRERSALWNLWLRTPQFSWREARVQVGKNVTPYFVKTCDIKYLLMVVFSTYSLTNDEVLCFVRYDEIWISQNFFDENGRIANSSCYSLIMRCLYCKALQSSWVLEGHNFANELFFDFGFLVRKHLLGASAHPSDLHDEEAHSHGDNHRQDHDH